MNHISPFSSPSHVRMAAGRIVIPVEFRKALGAEDGSTLVMRLEGNEVRIYTIEEAARRAQQFAKKYMKSKGSIVDELIAERRREAKGELE